MAFTAFNAPPPRAAPTPVESTPVPQTNASSLPSSRTKKQPSAHTVSLLQSAFSDRPDLALRLGQAATDHEAVFQDLCRYILDLRQEIESTRQASTQAPVASHQASKKRKIDQVGAENGASVDWADRSVKASHVVGDVSFSVPQRKKLRLEVLGGDAKNHSKGGLRAAGADGNIEFGMAWADIDYVFALPVPEKPKPQHNFVVIPKADASTATESSALEPIVWTVLEPGPKDIEASKEPAHTAALIDHGLKAFDKAVILPDSAEFESAIPQAHRKNEAAYHVKAFRGSKDGFLYFLSVGILFAFKKPLVFLPFSVIESVSYTSVLQRTFNLNIATETPTGEGDETKSEEIEFSMLDQADFAGIDEYVKRHGLHDASLAAGRRAKVYDVNKPRKAKGDEKAPNGTASHADGMQDEDDVGDDGMTELQRAEQQLQDEEDEMEEDYVDDDEDDDGSGSSDEEEYEEDGEGGEVGGEEEEDGDEE